MAVAALTGHGDRDVQELLPATVSPDRVALAGLHAWTEHDFPNVAGWSIASFSPNDLRATTRPLLDWLAATGCSNVAIHFDVDTIDSNELVLGLGAEPGGLTSAQAPHRRRHRCGGRCCRIHDRGVLSPAGHAPAADPGRLPADSGTATTR
jgi:arginase